MFPAAYWGSEYWGKDYWPPELEIIDQEPIVGGRLPELKGIGRAERERRKRLAFAALLHEAGLL